MSVPAFADRSAEAFALRGIKNRYSLAGTRFTSCKLVEVNFFDTRLTDADFTDSDLTGSRFEGCDLRGAQFAAARGFYADPAKNLVTGAHVNLETAVAIATVFGFKVDV